MNEQDRVIEIILKDVAEVKTDVKSLLEVKNKMLGFILAATSITTMLGTILFNAILLIFKK